MQNNQNTPDKKLLKVYEVAERLGISKQAVYRMIKGNILKHFRDGKRIYVPLTELDNFIARQMEGIEA